MMETGIVVAIVSGCAVIVAGIIKLAPARCAPSSDGDRAVTQNECEARKEATGAKIDSLDGKVDTLNLNMNAGFDRLDNAIRSVDRD